MEQTEEYLRRQAAKIHEHAVKSDIVICTAQIPGKPAPVLLLKNTVQQMQPGSVIIDIAAASGGNCELTKNGEVLEYNGVWIVGKSDYPSDMPLDASRMYGRKSAEFSETPSRKRRRVKHQLQRRYYCRNMSNFPGRSQE